jgi:hypothetical protein
MAVYTLLNTTSLGNPVGVAQVVPPVTRGAYTFTITGALTNYAQVTILASNDAGQDLRPIETLNIVPAGPNTITKEARFGSPFTIFDANLDNMSPGAGITATVTLTT